MTVEERVMLWYVVCPLYDEEHWTVGIEIWSLGLQSSFNLTPSRTGSCRDTKLRETTGSSMEEIRCLVHRDRHKRRRRRSIRIILLLLTRKKPCSMERGCVHPEAIASSRGMESEVQLSSKSRLSILKTTS